MDNPRDLDAAGPVGARNLAFLATITNLRPSLHRYCLRMNGVDSLPEHHVRRVIVDWRLLQTPADFLKLCRTSGCPYVIHSGVLKLRFLPKEKRDAICLADL
jgi:hypothetical protein